jgi:hypothetical protein
MRAMLVLVGTVALSACAPRLPVPTPTDTVDVLGFVIGDARLWPRLGTQLQNQQVDLSRREVCWTKYGRANAFECWRWDDRWIYHEVDHALDGDRTGRSYRFTDGRWLPRRLPIGQPWALDLANNQIVQVSADCVASAPAPFPYALTAHIEAPQVISPDLGTRAVLVLTYAPHVLGAQAAEPETFRFAEGAGWFAWSSVRGAARFDRLGSASVTRSAWCGEE